MKENRSKIELSLPDVLEQQHNVVYQERTLSVTISIGEQPIPLHGLGIQSLVNAEDAALYRAKENGRNQIVVAEKRL